MNHRPGEPGISNPALKTVAPRGHDEIRCGDGEPATGDHDYVIDFDADALPPAAAFWPVTMYDAVG